MGCGQAEVSCQRMKFGGTVCLKGRAFTHLGRVRQALAFVGASALVGSKPRKAGFTGRAVLTMATPRPKAEQRKEHSMVYI